MRGIAAAAAIGIAVGGWSSVAPAAQSAGDDSTPATYSRDVAPILYKNCTNCHRPGEIAPMSLLTYADARPWAKVDRRPGRARLDAAVACRSSARRVPERSASERRRQGDAPRVGERRRAGRHPADLPPRRRTTSAGRSAAPMRSSSMQEDYPIPADGRRSPISTLESPTNAHRRSLDSGDRGEARQSAPLSTT